MHDDFDQSQPVIIKRISKGRHGHHGGSWKVAFADFMTAMMAFFLVLWLVGQEQEVKDAVAGYFQDPVGFDRGGKIGEGEGIGAMQGAKGMMNRESATAVVRKRLQEAAEAIMQNLMLSDEFKALLDNIKVEMTPEGLRIQLVEGADSSFFESSSARMSATGQAIVGLVAQEVSKLPNRIVFEGHTDAAGSANQFGYTNWDLGADRANYCRKVALKNGIRDSQVMEVRSYADTRLLNEEDPLDPRNRRVSILVLNDYDYLMENNLIDLSDTASSPSDAVYSAAQAAPAAPDDTLPAVDEDGFEVPDYLRQDSL
ncbi:MAG TPA: flagellar motor protein MotB [candidate division Zixibacteria bacterium]|nr:flagellar motor protein MotB [candidate division Zixibacteria bacterium]